MSELFTILLTGAIVMGISYGLMFLLKVKPSKELPADTWIEGYIIGQQIEAALAEQIQQKLNPTSAAGVPW
jgi:hypothetical protein